MAHFAQVNEDNVVTQVLVVPDSEEYRGEEFLHQLGLGGRWIQTSFTGKIRKTFATPGGIYLEEADAFQPPKPSANPSFTFDESQWEWTAPLPLPEDADWVIGFGTEPAYEEVEIDGRVVRKALLPENPKVYVWDETEVSWRLLPPPPKSPEASTTEQ